MLSSVRKQILPKGKLIAIVAAILLPFFINNLTDLYELSDKEWSALSAICMATFKNVNSIVELVRFHFHRNLNFYLWGNPAI